MEFALNFLKNNVDIDSPALLSSPFLRDRKEREAR
jgi:hypothetical protein